MSPDFEESRKLLESLIGSKVNLIISSGLYKGSYSSDVQEIEDGLLGVSHPTKKGSFLPAMRSSELLIKIEGPSCIYQAAATAVRSVLNTGIPLLWLKLSSALEKVQRRMFVRVPATIKADCFFLGAAEEELPEGMTFPPREWFSVNISDISLGGIGVSMKQNLMRYCVTGGRYLLMMQFASVTFFIVGKIVKTFQKREGFIEVGFAYEGSSVSTEKIMGGYIRQQELMTRG